MRRLVITRGPQGSGKSTALQALSLSGHVISGDAIRQVLAGAMLSAEGHWTISQAHESRVWAQLFEHVEARMARGELLVIDATHRRRRDFNKYLKLARRYHYEMACLDFTPQPLEVALKQNRQRAAVEQVPEGIIRQTWEACVAGEVPEEVVHFPWQADGGHLQALRAWLSVPVRDLSGYRQVHHIGDLQGCITPLKAYYDAHGGVSDEDFHVFVGDLCDRGIENAEALRFVMALAGRPNVCLLWGNHEDHLDRWSMDEEGRSDTFTHRTQPELETAGITRAEVRALCKHFEEALLYQYGERKVMVTHAGLATVPDHIEWVSLHQLGRGTGAYADPVDARFSEQAPEGWFQVHGHRNILGLPIQASPRSFNLEGQVEYGGHLRCLRLDAEGFHPVEVPSTVFPALQVRLAAGDRRDRKRLPQWANGVPPEVSALRPLPLMPEADFKALQAHELVAERVSERRPHISAFNFTRDAFLDGRWDALNLTARGLFLNTQTRAIVARAYDKFFNVGERPETLPHALERSLTWPVRTWVKENGYLGIVGYDDATHELIFASKSSLESDFAGWLRARIYEQTTEGQREGLRRYLRDTQSSLTFEVVEPERDPHIIAYDRPRLILLDVIRRAPRFEAARYDMLERVGRSFGFEVKRPGPTFGRWAELAGWIAEVEGLDYTFEGQPLEGFVLEDAAGFQTKLKGGFYQFWKRLRGLKDRVLRVRGTDRPLNRDVSDPRVKAFYDWCMARPDEVLSRSIIDLRAAFFSGEGLATEVFKVTPPPPRALVGFQRALDGVARGEIKARTADELLGRALADDEIMAALAEHEVRFALIQAASPGDERTAAAQVLGVDLD